jgi:hypothetical protein
MTAEALGAAADFAPAGAECELGFLQPGAERKDRQTRMAVGERKAA